MMYRFAVIFSSLTDITGIADGTENDLEDSCAASREREDHAGDGRLEDLERSFHVGASLGSIKARSISVCLSR
jgi:hypothetical protein